MRGHRYVVARGKGVLLTAEIVREGNMFGREMSVAKALRVESLNPGTSILTKVGVSAEVKNQQFPQTNRHDLPLWIHLTPEKPYDVFSGENLRMWMDSTSRAPVPFYLTEFEHGPEYTLHFEIETASGLMTFNVFCKLETNRSEVQAFIPRMSDVSIDYA